MGAGGEHQRLTVACSLHLNGMRAAGASALASALERNSALKKLRCVI